MDFIPGIDGPTVGVPRVLACFSNVWSVFVISLVNFEILDFCFSLLFCIFVVIVSFLLHVTESPAVWATQACGWGWIPENFCLYKGCNWSCFVDDCEFRYTPFHFKLMFGIVREFNGLWIPGWDPKTSLWDLLESTLTYQHRTYAEAVKQAIAKPAAN
jgi:UDP-apiose/xylose synthase